MVPSLADQQNSVPSTHMRCRMTASFRATATFANPHRVVAITLVDLHFQCCLRLSGIDADDRQTPLVELSPQRNSGNTLVVGGLDACLDLLSPSDADAWLGDELKSAILSFQDEYSGEAALIFWLPTGQRRFHTEMATDAVRWRCSAPSADQQLEFGRLLWGEAREYPQEIVLSQDGKPVGLFHLRIT